MKLVIYYLLSVLVFFIINFIFYNLNHKYNFNSKVTYNIGQGSGIFATLLILLIYKIIWGVL